MEIQSFKSEYEKLAKKYKLPSYNDLNQDFELLYVGNLLEVSFPLRFVRRRLADKLAIYCNMFQSLMQPNPGSPISLQESKFFNEVQLKRMVEILKQLMYFERASFFLDTSPNEAEDAIFIKETVEAWKKYKKELTEFARIIKDTWKKEVKEVKENKNQYFG